MKYYIRRAIAGLLAIPLIAGAWVFTYLTLAATVNDFGKTLTEAYNDGLQLGTTIAIVFTFYPQLNKLINAIETL